MLITALESTNTLTHRPNSTDHIRQRPFLSRSQKASLNSVRAIQNQRRNT
jgi:hypothetical protein